MVILWKEKVEDNRSLINITSNLFYKKFRCSKIFSLNHIQIKKHVTYHHIPYILIYHILFTIVYHNKSFVAPVVVVVYNKSLKTNEFTIILRGIYSLKQMPWDSENYLQLLKYSLVLNQRHYFQEMK